MSKIRIPPYPDQTDPRVLARVTPEQADWQFLTFEARRLPCNEVWEAYTAEHEMAIVLLGGGCSLETSRGDWARVGRRPDIFSGMPYTFYLPRRTDFRLRALSEVCEIAAAWTLTDQDHPVRLLTPNNVTLELCGAGNASWQVNHIIPPGFACHRLMVQEVYTSGGNWSSYPPSKHDTHTIAPDGTQLESNIEALYFYKFGASEGYALQQVYTADRRLDALVRAQDNDTVIIPNGCYHAAVTAHGYPSYSLNIVVGSAQSLTSTADLTYARLRADWGESPQLDPRLPLVSLAMEQT